MVVITREQAICMFYCKEYNEKNVAKLTKEVDAIKNVDICYFDDSLAPVLLCIRTINQNPFKIHKYQKRELLEEDAEKTTNEALIICNAIELVQFLNIIYLPFDPSNSEVYENKCLTLNDILAVVWKYSDLFEDKSTVGFGKWCSNKEVNFMKSAIKRKESGHQVKRARSLYAVKEKFFSNIIKDITEYREEYQGYIQKLKKENHNVIGYARKSKGEVDDENRTRLIQLMCDRLRERSLVDKLFVSVCSNANHPISERDVKVNKKIIEKLDVDGNTQEMLQYISTNQKICLVVLDYAGLTTDPNDLKKFLEANKNIEKIIVDNFPQNNKVEIFERKEILNNPSRLEVFRCRASTCQRSK
ncbi:unnamed protein product [Rhizopus stolonifer]